MPLSLRIPSLRPIQEIVTLQPNPNEDDSVISVVEDGTTTESSRCYICNIRSSQYTCPRCHIPYCSVACYRKHGLKSSTSDSDASATADGCIENFYEQRVSQTLQLEVKEHSQQFKQQWIYHETSYPSNDSQFYTDLCSSRTMSDENPDRRDTLTPNVLQNDTAVTPAPLNREELQQIWSILEQIDDRKHSHASDEDDVTVLQQTLQQHCSIRVQAVVEQAIQNLTRTGTLHDDLAINPMHRIQNDVTEWIIEPWSPWWSSHFVPFGRHCTDMDVPIDDECENDNDEDCNIDDPNTSATLNDNLTLDERLISVPRLETLYRRKQSLDSDSNGQRLRQFPQLQYNLIDIIFATTYTLRTFHGVKNIGKDMALDAATALINSSLVLLKDRRYTSVESALMECCEINHPIQKQIQFHDRNKNSIGPSNSDMVFHLLHDVALIFRNHRYVARALLEASDILQEAITEIKRTSRNNTNSKNNTKGDVEAGTDTNGFRSQLRSIHKKIIFYLSWTKAVSSVKTSVVQRGWPYSHVSTDIQVWIEGWQLPSKAKSPLIKINV